MITGNTNERFAALADRLASRAEIIGREWVGQAVLERRRGPRRWRNAEYLWPRFVKG